MALLSLLTVAGGSPGLLDDTVASLRAQRDGDWQLCVAGVATPPAADPRVVPVPEVKTSSPAEALNASLDAACGELVAIMEPGDRLHVAAVQALRDALAADPEADLLYTDEDQLTPDGRHTAPRLKPGWSPDRLRVQPYTGRLAAARRSLVQEQGGVRLEAGDALEWDLTLRVAESARRVAHVPRVLYHRLRTPGPTDLSARLRVAADHLARTDVPADVEADAEDTELIHLRPRLRERPLVSIIVPTAGRARRVHGAVIELVVNCVESVISRSTYDRYEIICVVDDDTPHSVRARLAEVAGPRLRLVPFHEPFNFARKINAGALEARGEYLLLLNDDTEVISEQWIESMLLYGQLDGVGAVGAKLLFGDGRLQHVGIAAVGGVVGHPYYGFPSGYRGYLDNTRVPCNVLAVTAACLMVRRARFEEVGGMSTSFPRNYNDVDLCLKLGHAGYRHVVNPDVVLYHYESSTRDNTVDREEQELLEGRWGGRLACDPYYNPAFGTVPDFVPPTPVLLLEEA